MAVTVRDICAVSVDKALFDLGQIRQEHLNTPELDLLNRALIALKRLSKRLGADEPSAAGEDDEPHDWP